MAIPQNELGNVLPVPLIITYNNAEPAIMLRTILQDPLIMKAIISAAFHGKPILIAPYFKNKYQAVNSLQEKGLIVREDSEYFLTI